MGAAIGFALTQSAEVVFAVFTALALGLVLGQLSFHMSLAAFGWLALLALVSQTLGWLLITSSLPHLPASISSLLLLLQPAAALLLAAVVLGQQPTLVQLFGVTLVCAGVLITARSGWSRDTTGLCWREPVPEVDPT